MPDEPSPNTQKSESGSLITKAIAGVFAAVIAPVLVVIGTKWASRFDAPEKEPPKAAASVNDDPKKDASKNEPPPFGVVNLITPNLANHFYLYGWNEAQKKDARSDTIDPAIFRYAEKPDRIVVTGGPRGYTINTKTEYEDYTLHVWYRFAEKAYQSPNDPPLGRPRNCSIGIHATGPDGAVMRINSQNVAVRLGEGQAGTINLVSAPGALQCTAKVVESDDKRRRVYSPDAPAIPLEVPEGDGSFLILRRGYGNLPSPSDLNGLKAEGAGRGWHPDGDPSIKKGPPYGDNDWNRVRIDCHGSSVRVQINNKVMNEITDLNVHRGRIAFSCQGADYEIGRLEIELKPAPSATIHSAGSAAK